MCHLDASHLAESRASHARQHANAILPLVHFFSLRLWSVGQPNTLSLDTPVFNVWVFQPAVVSLLSLLADEHQMLVPLSPLLYSRFSHKQYITVILSSSRPQERGLRGSQRIRLPSCSCGRMSFHLQFAARNTSKRRYSLWEVHVPASVWSLWPSAWVQVWPGAVGQPVFSQWVMFSTWGGCTLKTDWPAGSVKQ